ncbi:hypothetical protein [Streptomyces sp. NPDC056796]
MIRGFEEFLDWSQAYAAYLADPESDPALIVIVEEHYGVSV